jgi:CheY-like chemotaxis protein
MFPRNLSTFPIWSHDRHDFLPNLLSITWRMNNLPSGITYHTQEIIEIQLWDTYLTRSGMNLERTLSAYALDGQPLEHHSDTSKAYFRFMLYDWDKTIRNFLSVNQVPFEVARVFKTDVMKQMEKKIVYIAEDDLNILFALNTMLEEAGYDVLMSHCGAAMLNGNLQSADVFILDKRMPDVDGIEVCRHLKSQPATRHIPVIMISALHNIASQAIKAGADDFLEKPFQMHELLQLVSKHTMSEPQASDGCEAIKK